MMKKNTEYLSMIECLIRSPLVKFYNIGITKSFNSRRSSYKNLKVQNYLYFIDAEISGRNILDIEKSLFELLTENKRSIFFKKYDPDKRTAAYVKSGGGISIKEIEKLGREYYLYVAVYTE